MAATLDLFVPHAHAASTADAFGRAIEPIVVNIVNPIVMLMFAVAVVVFVYGIVEMVSHGGDPDARTKGRNHMLGGVVGMFIMLSAWGIIHLVANTVGQIGK
jgi:alcohol dehydrogenase class IV